MRLEDFHDKHKGRVAFVLGSGPSLHFDKLDGLAPFVTFAVNASIMKYKHADYFVSDYPGVADWDYYTKTLPKITATSFFPAARFKDIAYHVKDAVLYESKEYYDPLTKQLNPDGLKVTNDPKKPVIWSRTSCGAAVHLATVMGCNPIILVGNDCCCTSDKGHFYDFPGEHKPHRYKGHPMPSLRKTLIRGKSLDEDHRDMIDYWQAFAKANPYLNIINTSTQGVLDSFPKMQLADVISRYSGLKKEL